MNEDTRLISGWDGSSRLAFSLRYGLGLPLLIAALAGMVAVVFVDWRRAIVVWAFPVLLLHRQACHAVWLGMSRRSSRFSV
jgi:hypothetical protein